VKDIQLDSVKNTSELTRDPSKITQNTCEMSSGPSEVTQGPRKLTENTSDITFKDSFHQVDGKWKCVRCDKVMSTNAKRHHYEQACRRKLHILQCKYCDMMCKHAMDKSRHQKRCGKRSSLQLINPSKEGEETPATINNTTINNNNTVINIIQNNHNNIVLNPFGQEDWDGLWELCGRQGRTDFETLKTQLVTQGMDGISKLIEHHYFNKDYPKNHTIRKPVKNNDFVEVHVGNNEWEHKTMATAMENIKESTTMYLQPMIEEVLNDSYEQDKQIQKYVNRLFTNVLVPMNYEICEKYKDRLRDVEPVGTHMSEQHGQIVMRNMKTVLHHLSLKLKSLSENIDVR
jgi:hypothetical protein